MHEEYQKFSYSEKEMPAYFLDVLNHVIKRIEGGSVCDLGSHAIGHYWAMGYIERVDSYSCYDLSAKAIQLFKHTINNWKPGDILKHYPVYMGHLYENKIIEQKPEIIEQQIIDKLDVVRVFDFLNDTPDKQYDIVLASESIETVDTYPDLIKAMKTAYAFLHDGGCLLCTSCPYNQETDDIKEMQKHNIEGRLSPSADMMIQAMKEAGFKEIEHISKPIVDFEEYHQLNIFSGQK